VACARRTTLGRHLLLIGAAISYRQHALLYLQFGYSLSGRPHSTMLLGQARHPLLTAGYREQKTRVSPNLKGAMWA